CAGSKASLSKASGITRWRYSTGAGLQYNSDASGGKGAPMPRFRTLDDLDVAGKRALVRADLNVPVKDGKVTDATRIERLAPTIEALLGKGAKGVGMSHFGRPKGPDQANSLP